jgi:hypothetical protein
MGKKEGKARNSELRLLRVAKLAHTGVGWPPSRPTRWTYPILLRPFLFSDLKNSLNIK